MISIGDVRRSSGVWIFPVLFFFTLFPLQKKIEGIKNRAQVVSNFHYIPSWNQLRWVSLAWKEAVADTLWIRAINFIPVSDNDPMGRGYDWFYGVIDRVTDLDPRFEHAYYLGGIILSIKSDRVELSNALLEKGLKQGPKNWKIPYLLGFNYTYHLKNSVKAAGYFQRASEIEGSPQMLPLIAAQLLIKGGEQRVALRILEKMYRDSKEEKLRDIVKERIKKLRAELGVAL